MFIDFISNSENSSLTYLALDQTIEKNCESQKQPLTIVKFQKERN